MSVVGTTQKQPRVFAHDAWQLSLLDGGAWAVGDPIVPALSTAPAGISYTFESTSYFYNVGGAFHEASGTAGLYIGAAMTELNVIMEGSGNQGTPTGPAASHITTFFGVPAGSFLPISVLTVLESTPEDVLVTPEDVILALF